MNPYIRRAMLVGVLGVLGMVYTAAADEVEPNNTVDTAQLLDISKGPVTIKGVLGNSTIPDVDFYRFSAKQDDVVTIDIDGGLVNTSGDASTDRDVDTVIAIFDVSDNLKMIASNNDAPDIDDGSAWAADARLDLVKLPHTGDYIVAVTSDPRSFRDGAIILRNTAPFDRGEYTLTIVPPVPPVLQISIDVKPGRRDIVPIDSGWREEKIPVALFSSNEFNATTVDTASLTFGATGDEQTLRRCHHPKDLNRDGLLDLVCDFDGDGTGFEVGDTQGILRGKTTDGRKFEGHGTLKVVAEKRRHQRHHRWWFPHIHWLGSGKD